CPRGQGADGRDIWTKDGDARAGHVSATNSRKAHVAVGRDVDLAVAVPARRSTDGATWVKLGPEVPQVVLGFIVRPAGSNAADAVCPLLVEMHADGVGHDVVLDRGYTMKRPERLLLPLQQHGMPVTMDLADYQRAEQPA